MSVDDGALLDSLTIVYSSRFPVIPKNYHQDSHVYCVELQRAWRILALKRLHRSSWPLLAHMLSTCLRDVRQLWNAHVEINHGDQQRAQCEDILGNIAYRYIKISQNIVCEHCESVVIA